MEEKNNHYLQRRIKVMQNLKILFKIESRIVIASDELLF